jgi:DUF4097 and DUF4098 domain-containing protein YvlB
MSTTPLSDHDVQSPSLSISNSRKDHERIEQYRANGPLHAVIRTASARVSFTNGTDDICRVRATLSGSSSIERLAQIEISFDEETSVLRVDTRPKGRRRVRIFDFHDIELQITVPVRSGVELHSASGDISLDGTYGDVSAASASGDVTAGVVLGTFTVNAASGDIKADQVDGDISVRSASGDISIGEISSDISIHAVSGDIEVCLAAPLHAKVHSVSGDLTVTVKPGFVVEVNVKTVSGSMRSDIALDADGSSPTNMQSSGVISINASTVSGDVRIARS